MNMYAFGLAVAMAMLGVGHSAERPHNALVGDVLAAAKQFDHWECHEHDEWFKERDHQNWEQRSDGESYHWFEVERTKRYIELEKKGKPHHKVRLYFKSGVKEVKKGHDDDFDPECRGHWIN